MNVYYCTGFLGHAPVGTSALVVAKDRGHARRLLDKKLKERSLPASTRDDQIVKVDTDEAEAVVLQDGVY